MRRLLVVSVLFVTGCSTAPVAGTLDCLFPSKAGRQPDYPPPPPDRGPRDVLPPPAGLSDPIPPPPSLGR